MGTVGEGRIRTRAGLSLTYVEIGEATGEPVLLLHAWAESSRCFDRLMPLLPATVHAFAIDQRGHGHADKPTGGYALDDFAGDVEAFLDAAGVRAAVLVGSSSGGYVAQQVAVRSPRRVRGLVLVGAPRSLRGRPSFAEEVDRLTDPVDRAWVRRSLAWFPLVQDVPDWYLRDRVEDGVHTPARVWRATLEGLLSALPPTEAGAITAPTLILCGARDPVLPGSEQRALAEAIPGSRLVVYDDVGHLVLWERPERVAADVAAFLDRLPPAG